MSPGDIRRTAVIVGRNDSVTFHGLLRRAAGVSFLVVILFHEVPLRFAPEK
jgi:hypothetical protein